MKASITNSGQKFSPFDITIRFESREETLVFWHRLHLPLKIVAEYASDDCHFPMGYYPPGKTMAFAVLDAYMASCGLKRKGVLDGN